MRIINSEGDFLVLVTLKIPLLVALSIQRDSFLTIYALVLYAIRGSYFPCMSLHAFPKSAILNQSVLFGPMPSTEIPFIVKLFSRSTQLFHCCHFVNFPFSSTLSLPFTGTGKNHKMVPMTTSSTINSLSVAWTSYQIRKIAGSAYAGNAVIVLPATGFKGTCHDACQDR